MDEILYLEPDEEITSVIDKLKGLPGKSVALVLPKNAQLAASVVNLKLLKREAQRLEKKVSIVTQDKVGTSLAGQVGIPVYASVSDEEPVAAPTRAKPQADDVIELDERPQETEEPIAAAEDEAGIPVHRYDATAQPTPRATSAPVVQEVAPEPAPVRRPVARPAQSRPGIRLRRGPVLTLIALAILGALAWLFLVYPRATVVLGVESDPVSETVTVTVDNNITATNEDEGKLSGQKVQVEKTVKQSFDATGSKEVGSKASGTATVNNRLGEEVAVPKGTTLARDGVSFVTTEETAVGAASVSLDASGNVIVKPGTKQVKVEAANVGSNGNVSPGEFTITSFSGAKRERVTASNSAAFTGGESHTVKVVTNDDIENAKKTIGEKVNEELVQELKGKANDLTILGNTIEVGVIDATANKAPDEEADNFELEAKLRARTIGFAAAGYQDLVVALVSKTLPDGKELVVTPEDSVETAVERQSYDEGVLVLKSTLKSEMVQTLDEAALRNLVRGKTATEAERLLGQEQGIRSSKVTVRPSFRSRIPGNDSQIVIELRRE